MPAPDNPPWEKCPNPGQQSTSDSGQAPPPGPGQQSTSDSGQAPPHGLGQHSTSGTMPGSDQSTRERGPKRTKVMVILCITSIVAVIAAAATGGVLGKSLRECQGALPTSAENKTAGGQCGTAANGGVAVPVGDDLVVGLDCPRINGTRQTVKFYNESSTFNVLCGSGLFQEKNEVGAIVAYRLEDCLRACAGVNHFSSSSQGRCVGVHFKATLGSWVAYWQANCFLKNGTANPGATSDPNNILAAAALV